MDVGDPASISPARAAVRKKTAPVTFQRSAGASPRRPSPGHLVEDGTPPRRDREARPDLPGGAVLPVWAGLGLGLGVTGGTFEAGSGVGGGVLKLQVIHPLHLYIEKNIARVDHPSG